MASWPRTDTKVTVGLGTISGVGLLLVTLDSIGIESVLVGDSEAKSVVEALNDSSALGLEDGEGSSLGDGKLDSDMEAAALAESDGCVEALLERETLSERDGVSLGEGVLESELLEEGVLESELLGEGVLESELVAEGDTPIVKLAVTEGETDSVADEEGEGVTLGEGVLESELVEEGDAPMVKLGVTESDTDSEADEEGVLETEVDSDGV